MAEFNTDNLDRAGDSNEVSGMDNLEEEKAEENHFARV